MTKAPALELPRGERQVDRARARACVAALLLIGALVGGAAVGANAEPSAPRLVSVSGERTQEGTRVLLRTDAPLERFEPFPLREPDRFVVDLPAATTDLDGRSFGMGTPEVAGVRVGMHPGRVRVVIDRVPGGSAPARVQPIASGLLVILAAARQAEAAAHADAAPTPVVSSPDEAPQPAASAPPARVVTAATPSRPPNQATPRLVAVSGQRTEQGTLVLLRTDAPVARFEPFPLGKPDRLVIDLPAATTDLDGRRFGMDTPEVAGVRVGAHPGRVRVVIDRVPGRHSTPARVQPIAAGLLVTFAAAREGAGLAPSPPLAQAGAPAAADPDSELEREATPGAAPAGDVSAPPVQAAPALAPSRAAEPARPLPDGLPYPVSEIVLVYAKPHPDLPPLAELGASPVTLGRLDDGYVAPKSGVPTETVSVVDVSRAPAGVLYGSAIKSLNEALVADLNRRGLVAIRVSPHEQDIDPETDRDLRAPGQRRLRLVITTGVLLEHRTFASGDRVPDEEAIDNPVHAEIKSDAPIQPGDLVWKPRLDEYVARLNRHSGRRVDTTLSAATEPGGVYLDYLVAEHRPLTLYAQVGNTGTEETSDWRERFGLTHTQVTGRDDILRLDYITANFDEVNASWASYEAPFPGSERVRWRLGGSWSEYDASELGSGAEFTGKQWDVGLEGIVNVFQRELLFVDLFAGVRWLEIRVENDPIPGFALVSTDGEDDFFLPAVGVRVERLSETTALTAALAYEWNVASFANTDANELADLGRVGVDDSHFETLNWDLTSSLFLDPLLDRMGIGETEYPGARLAHEVAFLTRGQYAFGDRLVPQFEQVAGGLYSVRGYPQSLVAGDDVAIATAEYRLHIPRLLGYRPTPAKLPVVGDFRVAPQQPYGTPDWDLIVRAFVDGAVTGVNDPVPGEDDQTLLGAGAGIEVRLLRNWIVRFDWGRALRSAGTRPDRQHSGSDQYYIQTTVLW